jgi:hypothetical protein
MGGWRMRMLPIQRSLRLLCFRPCGKTRSCGGSALEHGARRIVDGRWQVRLTSVLARPGRENCRPVAQGSATCKKQTGMPGLRITIIAIIAAPALCPSTVLSEFSSKFGNEIRTLCVRRPRGLGMSHAPERRAHTPLLHHNRKTL